jgi:antitoxin (DNA-binding transcriptional repressor) of toxin-antitoxin stability system
MPRLSSSPVFSDGEVRGVAVGALNRGTSRIIDSLRDGERLIVTRHHDPVAVVLSPRDAMEVLAAPALVELADAALREQGAERLSEPWPHVGPFKIQLATVAQDCLHRVGGRDRGALKRRLGRGDADPVRPLWLPSGRWLAPFSYAGEASVMVHALVDIRELERELIGEEVWQRRLVRDLDRHAHARTPWQRAARADEGHDEV